MFEVLDSNPYGQIAGADTTENFTYNGTAHTPVSFAASRWQSEQWLSAVALAEAHKRCKAAVVALIGMRKFRHSPLDSNAVDITMLIARDMVWATRHHEVWSG